MTGPLLRTTPEDRYFDYCLEPYQPRRATEGKLRGENLLWRALALGAGGDAAVDPIRAIQRSLGRDLTVWGVKFDGQRVWWELYFYDPQKRDPAATASSIAEVVAPWLRIEPAVDESIPYAMFSFDLDAETARSKSVRALNLYLTGTALHAGRSYALSTDGWSLQNTYRFFHPKREIDDVLGLVHSSVYVDYTDPSLLGKVLIPDLFACKRVCVAKKQDCDAVYFSGLSIEQLSAFLGRFDYPEPLRAFAAEHAQQLDHLYFDVGMDYRQNVAGGIDILKTSFYATL